MKLIYRWLVSMVLLPMGELVVAQDFTIANVRVYGGPGVVSEPMAIRVSDGKIVAIDRRIDVAGSVLYSGQGGLIVPGYIDSGSTVGLEEVGSSSTRTQDHSYQGEGLSAGFDPTLAFNNKSTALAPSLNEGVTHVMLKPSPSVDLFAGQGGIVNLSGEFGVANARTLFVYLGERGRELAGKSRAAALQRLVLGIEEGRLYRDKRRAYDSNRLRSLAFTIQDLEVLAAVASGEKKLAISVNRASEIESVLMMLDPFDLDIVLYGAREAWKVPEVISSRNIPVVINVLDNLPRSFDQLGARLDHAKLLHDAGILFAFMTDDQFTDTRMLSQAAGVAVAHGLPWQAALDAITKNPAIIWGLEDRLGSLQPGMEATFTIWDFDPLEVTSQAALIVIEGRFVELPDRQKMLRNRYLHVKEGVTPFSYR